MSFKNIVVLENSYSLGVRSLDEQHKKLFILVNRFYKLKKTQNIKEEMREILYGFREYILVHFKEEEEYMQLINYPQLQEHKKLHNEISDSIIQEAVDKLNHRPRKCLKFRTPYEVLYKTVRVALRS